MGVDVYALLPPDVDEGEVAEVIGKILGSPSHMEDIHFHGATAVRVDKAKLDCASNVCHCANVVVDTATAKEFGAWPWVCVGHFNAPQYGHPKGIKNNSVSTYVSMRSSPGKVATLAKLVDFFGGVVANDYDNKVIHSSKRHCPKDKYGNIPQGGDEWQEYQNAIHALQPITQKEVEKYRKYSAYNDAPDKVKTPERPRI